MPSIFAALLLTMPPSVVDMLDMLDQVDFRDEERDRSEDRGDAQSAEGYDELRYESIWPATGPKSGDVIVPASGGLLPLA